MTKQKAKPKTIPVDPGALRTVAKMLRMLATALDDLAAGRAILAEETPAALKGT